MRETEGHRIKVDRGGEHPNKEGKEGEEVMKITDYIF